MRKTYRTQINNQDIDITVVYHGEGEKQFPYEITFYDKGLDSYHSSYHIAYMYRHRPDPKCDQAVIKGYESGWLQDMDMNINDINTRFGPTVISGSYTWLTTNINNSVDYKTFMDYTLNIKIYDI